MIKEGRILLVGECRGARAEVIRYVDKKTGQKQAFTAINYVVERAGSGDPVIISQQYGEGEHDPASIQITVQKGKNYAFELSSLETSRGVVKARMQSGMKVIPL